MIFSQYPLPAVIVLIATALILLLRPNWRVTYAAFAVQYLAVFWLTSISWPVTLAAVKLIVGIMSGVVLATSQNNSRQVKEEELVPSGRIFRAITAILVGMVIFPAAPTIAAWFTVSQPIAQGSLVLMGLGLLQLGMTNSPTRIIIALLGFLSGFEILYAALEVSVLVAGLLAVVTLALALAGAYLLSNVAEEEV
jgi:hypothetical protein